VAGAQGGGKGEGQYQSRREETSHNPSYPSCGSLPLNSRFQPREAYPEEGWQAPGGGGGGGSVP